MYKVSSSLLSNKAVLSVMVKDGFNRLFSILEGDAELLASEPDSDVICDLLKDAVLVEEGSEFELMDEFGFDKTCKFKVSFIDDMDRLVGSNDWLVNYNGDWLVKYRVAHKDELNDRSGVFVGYIPFNGNIAGEVSNIKFSMNLDDINQQHYITDAKSTDKCEGEIMFYVSDKRKLYLPFTFEHSAKHAMTYEGQFKSLLIYIRNILMKIEHIEKVSTIYAVLVNSDNGKKKFYSMY